MKYLSYERIKLPEFFVITKANSHISLPVGTVVALTDYHDQKGWVTVGIVSKQSPYGQGMFCGVPRSKMRKAKRIEVLATILQNHPKGENFRPTVHPRAMGKEREDHALLMMVWELITLAQRLTIEDELT